jgi:hypothetical protein
MFVKLRPELITGIQNTAFCQMNGIQSERTQNKCWYFVRLGTPAPHALRPKGGVCRSLIYTTGYGNVIKWLVDLDTT